MINRYIEYLFFNFYNWYLKMGLYRPKISPGPQTVLLFVMGSMGWLIFFYAMYEHVILRQNVKLNNVGRVVVVVMVLIFFFIYNKLFIDNDKYLEIYRKYKDFSESNLKKKRDLFLSFTIIFIPYLFGMTYTILNFLHVIPW